MPVGIPSTLLERRPDVAQAERNVQAQSEQIGVAVAAFYPTVTLSASGGISGLADLEALRAMVPHGVEGAIVGKALYAGRFTLAEALDAAGRPEA